MDRYFKFPLSLMQQKKNDNDKAVLMKIIGFAFMDFSEKMGYNKSSVANQIIYLFYRNPSALPKKIKLHLNDMIDDGRLIEDEDYHGFSGNTFTPEQENEGMMKEFDEDPGFYRKCIGVYRERQAISFLNLNPSLKHDFEGLNNEAKVFIQSYESKHGPDAWTSVNNSLVFDAFNKDEEMVYFRLVAAVKSVIGNRNLNLTYKSVLLCRMFGAKKASILDELFIDNPELKAKHEFLSKRRQWEKLIDTAEEKGYFSYYCTQRQFFVSITMTKEELRSAIEKKRELNITA